MIGVIIGDIVGSVYEFDNIKTKDFPLFSRECDFTDDSIMSLAVARALLECKGKRFEDETLKKAFAAYMKWYGRQYPYPMGGYGGRFGDWLRSCENEPYNSWGNGSAMRVAACGFAAKDLNEALRFAELSSSVTHNHPEAIAGAKAVAACIYMAKSGLDKEYIHQYVHRYYYPLDMSLDEIRKTYTFTERCKDTVPQAIQAFLEAKDFEDAIRNAISIGGDSDTIGAITGGIAEAYFGVSNDLRGDAESYLPDDLFYVLKKFEETYQN